MSKLWLVMWEDTRLPMQALCWPYTSKRTALREARKLAHYNATEDSTFKQRFSPKSYEIWSAMVGDEQLVRVIEVAADEQLVPDIT